MAKEPPRYKKLPGRVAGPVFGITRLWYGDDHLMCVSSAFGYENYKRVYFRDVEAFIVRRTKVRLIWNIIFGVVVATATLIAVAIIGSPKSNAVAEEGVRAVLLGLLGGPAVIALIALIINTFKGPTCTFWVQTAGGLMRLSAPVRVRVARKVLDVVAPLVVQAQSERQSTVPVTQ